MGGTWEELGEGESTGAGETRLSTGESTFLSRGDVRYLFFMQILNALLGMT